MMCGKLGADHFTLAVSGRRDFARDPEWADYASVPLTG